MSELVSLALALLRQSLAAPRIAARQVMEIGAGFDRGVLWLALVLVAVLSSLLTHLGLVLLPAAEGAGLTLSPIGTALAQFALIAVFLWAIVGIGRWRGGSGTWDQALALMVWLQALLLGLQLLQLVVLVIFVPLAELIGMLGIVFFFFLLTQFVAEMHGFRSALSVFFGILLTMFVLAFGLAFLLAFMGVTVDV